MTGGRSRARSRVWTAAARAMALVVLALTCSPAPLLAQEAATQQTDAEPTTSPTAGVVFRIPVTGVVEMGLAPFISRSLSEAEAAG